MPVAWEVLRLPPRFFRLPVGYRCSVGVIRWFAVWDEDTPLGMLC